MKALNKQALREAAEKATPGRIGDRIDGSGSIKYECHGYDGSLVLRTDHKDMEYGFIGDNGNADELFFRLCVPDVILALLDELEAAEKRIAEQREY
ncbi:TPA: ead/Ea22-like family protein [Escherichia coli]|nr:ead/Ea22-like family protein [Escherichia coli]